MTEFVGDRIQNNNPTKTDTLKSLSLSVNTNGMRLFYTFFVYTYGFAIHLASFFNPKAKQWVQGRKAIFTQIKSALSKNNKPLIWIHAASLGEFEQGRPIIEELKEKHPEYGILLTFFSPSGYEVRKNYASADFVFYLPLDTPKNAKQFLEIANIKLAVFIKYEYWYNYLNALQKNEIPLVFVSAILRPKQIFFQAYGSWFLKHLKKVNWFFVQTQESLDLLSKKGITNASLSGDTRFDRVAEIAKLAKPNDMVAQFKGNSQLLLAGSSWPEDEAIIYPLLTQIPELKIIFAPHQIDPKHIAEIEKNCNGKSILYSKAKKEQVSNYKVLIIDNFGLLSSLYHYADFTFIGGGFGTGIHNTLEAATFGMPIFIGPNYEKFQEAKDLVNLHSIFVVEDKESLQNNLEHFISNPEKRREKGQKAQAYVQAKIGATQHILGILKEKKWL